MIWVRRLHQNERHNGARSPGEHPYIDVDWDFLSWVAFCHGWLRHGHPAAAYPVDEVPRTLRVRILRLACRFDSPHLPGAFLGSMVESAILSVLMPDLGGRHCLMVAASSLHSGGRVHEHPSMDATGLGCDILASIRLGSRDHCAGRLLGFVLQQHGVYRPGQAFYLRL